MTSKADGTTKAAFSPKQGAAACRFCGPTASPEVKAALAHRAHILPISGTAIPIGEHGIACRRRRIFHRQCLFNLRIMGNKRPPAERRISPALIMAYLRHWQ